MTAPLLPSGIDDDELARSLREDPGRFRSAVDVVASRERLPSGDVDFCPDGSRPVFASDRGWVVKLYPPSESEHHRVERDALEVLARSDVPAPEVIASGSVEGWPYLVMTRIAGRPLTAVREDVTRDELVALMAATGELLACMHDLDASTVGWDPTTWSGFVTERRARCVDEQRALGLDDHWLAQVPDFVDRHVGPLAPPSFLHTEVMAQHLFVDRGTDGVPAVTGLIDLEPAMLGAPRYEFAAVGIFLTEGDAELLRVLLGAYGYEKGQLTRELQRELLAWTVLHRYAHLPWFLERMPPAPGVRTLDDLAAQWFAL